MKNMGVLEDAELKWGCDTSLLVGMVRFRGKFKKKQWSSGRWVTGDRVLYLFKDLG